MKSDDAVQVQLNLLYSKSKDEQIKTNEFVETCLIFFTQDFHSQKFSLSCNIFFLLSSIIKRDKFENPKIFFFFLKAFFLNLLERCEAFLKHL